MLNDSRRERRRQSRGEAHKEIEMTGQHAKVERQNTRELKEEEHLKRGERAFNKGRGEEGVCPPEDNSSLDS